MSGDDQHTILSMGASQSEVAATPPKKPISLLGRVLIGLLWCLLIETFLGLWAVQAGGFVPSSLGNDSVLVSLVVGAISGVVLALRADEKRITKLWMKDPFMRSLALGCVGGVFVACACVGLL